MASERSARLVHLRFGREVPRMPHRRSIPARAVAMLDGDLTTGTAIGAPYAPQAGIAPAAYEGLFGAGGTRSEEHTSELQSQSNLVCRLLLEKKKKKTST